MAYKDLSDIFYLMRSKFIANKSDFHDNQYMDDRTALVVDLDNGNVKAFSKIPPDWTMDVEEIHLDIINVKKKLKELSSLHDKHLNRPRMDDNNFDEEKSVDFLTQEITHILGVAQNKVRKISLKANMVRTSESDKRLMKNVVGSLASSMQEVLNSFRKSQNLYLKKIQSRKERSNMLFGTSEYLSTSTNLLMDDTDYDEEFSPRHSQNEQQTRLQASRVNALLLDEREKEINHIVKSIHDLNELFSDLATMVVDQGTVLDRIDCNIEKVSHHVDAGLVELQKANKYTKANRKMYIIAVLMVIFLLLFFILILTKF
jgi:syntaxin 16